MTLEQMFHIKEKSWYEIISWAKIAYDEDKNEISGLATAVPNKEGYFILSDVEILKQENSGSNTELDGDAVTAYKMKYGMKYKNPNMKFVWWHSHHTMEAFWSGTDEKEINAWENDSFSLALVVNLKEEYKFRVSLWKAAGLNIEQHYDIPLNIMRTSGVNVTEPMKKMYKELCSDKHSYVHHRINQGQINKWNNSFKKNTPTWNNVNNYHRLLEAIESANDEFMDGSKNLSDWKTELNTIQDQLDVSNITDFKLNPPKGNKQVIINTLMTMLPEEMVEFKDNDLKESYQSELDSWHGYNGFLH